MQVSVVIFVLSALLSTKAQDISNNWNVPQWNTSSLNKTQWNIPAFNKTQWNSGFNKTQWNHPSSNRTQWNNPGWNIPAFNRTQWNSGFNKTQWNHPAFNRTQWNNPGLYQPQSNPAINRTNKFPTYNRTQHLNHALNREQNRTQWNLHAIDRGQLKAKNRTQGRFELLNGTINSNGSRWNHPRPRRSELKWGPPVPTYNNTWNQTTHNGDVIIGQIGVYDRLLFNQTYRKDSRWWSGREKIIEYPKDLPGKSIYRQETITAIRIYNKLLHGLESEARILSGGVGYRYVKIELSSPWNRGFSYLVQLFGH